MKRGTFPLRKVFRTMNFSLEAQAAAMKRLRSYGV